MLPQNLMLVRFMLPDIFMMVNILLMIPLKIS